MFKLTPRFLLLISLGTLFTLAGCGPAMSAVTPQSFTPSSIPDEPATPNPASLTISPTSTQVATRRASQTLQPSKTPILNTIVYQTQEPSPAFESTVAEDSTAQPGSTQEVPATENPTSGPAPTQASTSPGEIPKPSSQPPQPAIVWKATHEKGDLREWKEHGDFIQQGQSAYYSMVTSPVHSGKYAVGLTIDTQGASRSGNFAAYLFYWDQLPNQGYYYSAWYYIPTGTRPEEWWNIWQWKSTSDGNTDNSVPMYSLDLGEKSNGELALSLFYRPDINGKIIYRQNIKNLPTNKWVQIEAYYKKASNNSGEVIVWQDGVEIFKLTNVTTTLKNNTVYWSVSHYTNSIRPSPSTIFIDDAAISTQRIGPDYTLPQ